MTDTALRAAAVATTDLSEFRKVNELAQALGAVRDLENQIEIHKDMTKRVLKKLNTALEEAKTRYSEVLARLQPQEGEHNE